jgi:hypothetical protein
MLFASWAGRKRFEAKLIAAELAQLLAGAAGVEPKPQPAPRPRNDLTLLKQMAARRKNAKETTDGGDTGRPPGLHQG